MVSRKCRLLHLAGRSWHQPTDGSWLCTGRSLPATASRVLRGIGFPPTIRRDSEPVHSFSNNSTTSPIPSLEAKLADGSIVSVPLAWYPRLVHATPEERDNWELVSQGQGVRWPDLDEDLSVEGLITGRRSGESQRSFERWLEAKRGGRSVLLYDLIQVARPTEKNSP